MAASAHGSEGVRCLSPGALPTGWSSVELSSHGAALRSGGSFYVHAALHVSELVPPAGPVAGGTRVSVVGSTFREAATLRCRFEASGATAAARRVGGGQLECAAPPSSAAGARRVEVSANGQQFSAGGVAFTYRPAASVSSVWPVRGAAEGGTPLTVLGGGFSASAEASGALRCRFNATAVAAAYVSEAALACNATASAAGYASVEVSTNGREYTASGVRFELVSLVVSGLAPWSGPALGGTVVTIGGSRLAHAAALACAFGAAAAAVGAAAVGAAAVGTGAAWMAASAHGSEGCLLYTSPSPRDATLSRMPSSA